MTKLWSLLPIALGLLFVAHPALAGTVRTPEPATMSLVAVAIGGVALAKFRRRR